VWVAGIWAAYALGIRPETLRELVRDGGPALARYTRPDGEDLPHLLGLMGETVAMGLWGSAITLAFAIVLAPLAARSLSPNPIAYRVTRELLNFCRAMPDALLALVFIQGLGLGPLPGAIALGVHSTGFVGKALAEAMERLPNRAFEGLAACGASRRQSIRFCAWPSIDREVVGYALFIFDRNVRVATTLGIVGAGGIGVELLTSLRTFDVGRSATILAIVVATILLIDAVSGWLRRRLA
jgi:phosphonate transport system permease protein